MYTLLIIFGLLAGTNAHISPFHKGMFCINGTTPGEINQNTNAMVNPLYQLTFEDWWFHHVNGCDKIMPLPGDYLELPAGGTMMVEMCENQAFSTLSYGGSKTSDWPDGQPHLNPNFNDLVSDECITAPNMHTQNASRVAGSAFAISYVSKLADVTMDNHVVFTTNASSPWRRVTTFEVPAKMPPCPAGGCICSWGWVPNGCGQPNMYMQGYKCNVTGSTSNTPLAPPKPPVWCEGVPNNCTQGAKQIIAWNQLNGNNIEVEGFDQAGDHKSPAYNMKCGFRDGAQNDIFLGSKPNSKRGEDTNNPVIKSDISSHRRNSRSFRQAARNLFFHS